MLVGEAPGASEDAAGRPFVGRAGQLLDELLGVAGLARAAVYITNVVKARPPGNRDPRADEVAHHMPWLEAAARAHPAAARGAARSPRARPLRAGREISEVHGTAASSAGAAARSRWLSPGRRAAQPALAGDPVGGRAGASRAPARRRSGRAHAGPAASPALSASDNRWRTDVALPPR